MMLNNTTLLLIYYFYLWLYLICCLGANDGSMWFTIIETAREKGKGIFISKGHILIDKGDCSLYTLPCLSFSSFKYQRTVVFEYIFELFFNLNKFLY